MVSGDLIEWMYEQNGELVTKDEELWSTLMIRHVPIGSTLVHILVSIDDEQIMWLNEVGLFHARVGDRWAYQNVGDILMVVPRKKRL